jgi:hypothetical protein
MTVKILIIWAICAPLALAFMAWAGWLMHPVNKYWCIPAAAFATFNVLGKLSAYLPGREFLLFVIIYVPTLAAMLFGHFLARRNGRQPQDAKAI